MTISKISSADDVGLKESGDGTLEAARSIAEAYLAPRYFSVSEPGTGLQAVALMHGRDIDVDFVPARVFDEFRPNPKARQGTAAFTSLDSFIAHFQRFAGEHSAVFACDNRLRPSLTGVLDYHDAGADGTPQHMRHRSTYSFPLSDEWKAWQEANSVGMSMGDFARFLEDRIVDVLPVPGTAGIPALEGDILTFVEAVGGVSKIASPAKLLEIANGLKINEESVVEQAQNVSSGEMELKFQSKHRDEAGQILRVPSLFIIGIPVFHNGAPYRLAARLRYRKTPNGVVFFYDLWRADKSFDHAFDEAIERVAAETQHPVFIGAPEA